MNTKIKIILCFVPFLVFGCNNKKNTTAEDLEQIGVKFYMSKPDKTVLFGKQTEGVLQWQQNDFATIEIDSTTKFQAMDGFGFTLTGGSAMHLANMQAEKRSALLKELFDFSGENIGISYLRLSLGASDLDANVFSYCDEKDPSLSKFSIAKDKEFLIPILKEILAINPDIKLLASPWSPPVWMKTNGSSIGGSLKPEFYATYANYFVKYIRAMEAEGIVIDAITVQNEPLHPGNNPSLLMPANEQAAFVKKNLGPLFELEKIKTKIIIYDHNADKPEYPITILDDAEAKKYIDGSAFHLYGGEINALSLVHKAHPDKNLYFTEQWIGAPGDFANDLKWHINQLVIGASRNWCKTVLEWNLAANKELQPHTDDGCTECLGALTIDGDAVVRNPAYYIIAHASKFVRPQSVRIESSLPDDLQNVAFKTPEGKIVLIVINNSKGDKSVNIKQGEKIFTSTLVSGAVGTYVF